MRVKQIGSILILSVTLMSGCELPSEYSHSYWKRKSVKSMSLNGGNEQTLMIAEYYGVAIPFSVEGDEKILVGGNRSILLMEEDGSRLRTIVDQLNGSYENVTVSRNGKWIAFIDDNQLCVMQSDGTMQRVLTHPPSRITSPAFSIDGNRIVFVYLPNDASDVTGIGIIDTDGSDYRVVISNTQNPSGFIEFHNPALHPDGETIFYRQSHGEQPGLYTIKADGSGRTLIFRERSLNSKVTFSEYGHLIAFSSGRDIFILDWSIRILKKIGEAEEYSAENLVMSGDGEILLFNTYDNIYSIHTDGTGITRLAEGVYPFLTQDETKIIFMGKTLASADDSGH